MLIDCEYCTGCPTCEVACAQKHAWPAEMAGLKVIEIIENLPNGNAYPSYLPFPTELCALCASRTQKDLEPEYVKHCLATRMTYGPIRGAGQGDGEKAKDGPPVTAVSTVPTWFANVFSPVWVYQIGKAHRVLEASGSVCESWTA